MRLWTLHPCHLDAKGLVALWREALLAQAVLSGQTRGYRNHPQLQRFAACRDPIGIVGRYLACVHEEASNRGYTFADNKITKIGRKLTIPVGRGQVQYEREHLLHKLAVRDQTRCQSFKRITLRDLQLNPLFSITDGPIEPWEKVL